jgi:hypothetical protein
MWELKRECTLAMFNDLWLVGHNFGRSHGSWLATADIFTAQRLLSQLYRPNRLIDVPTAMLEVKVVMNIIRK